MRGTRAFTYIQIWFAVDLPSWFINIRGSKIVSQNTLNMIPPNLFLCERSNSRTNRSIRNFCICVQGLHRSCFLRKDLQLLNAFGKIVLVFEEIGIHCFCGLFLSGDQSGNGLAALYLYISMVKRELGSVVTLPPNHHGDVVAGSPLFLAGQPKRGTA